MDKNKNIDNMGFNMVIARLVATYDLNPNNEVKSIDYLCIYEYEYKNQVYKYRMHQRDNFTDVPEEIELYFKDDPNKVFQKKNNNTTIKQVSPTKSLMFQLGATAIAIIILILILLPFIKAFIDFDVSIIVILFILILVIIIVCNSNRKNKKIKNKDELLEQAILDNRKVTAYLIKSRRIYGSHTYGVHARGTYPGRNYKAKYEYEYNGKKYKTICYFEYTPPKNILLFLDKKPKNIISMKY